MFKTSKARWALLITPVVLGILTGLGFWIYFDWLSFVVVVAVLVSVAIFASLPNILDFLFNWADDGALTKKQIKMKALESINDNHHNNRIDGYVCTERHYGKSTYEKA